MGTSGAGESLVRSDRILLWLFKNLFHSLYAEELLIERATLLRASILFVNFTIFFKKHQKLFAVMQKFLMMSTANTQNVRPQPLECFLLLLQNILLPLTVFLLRKSSPYPRKYPCKIRAPVNLQRGHGNCFSLK